MVKRFLALTLFSLGLSAAGVQVTHAATPTCNGHAATIVRGGGNDRIVGTSGPDVIVAGAGNDRIFGGAGNDIICGGAGNDLIDGAAGKDPVYGGAGRDLCFASNTAEHSLHHGCEVHLGAPVGDLPPGRGGPQFKGASAPAASQGECDDSSCYAGQPVCYGFGPNETPALNFRDGIEPIAHSFYDQGRIAVSLEIDTFDESNTQYSIYSPTTVETYPNLSAGTNYYVPPSPDVVGLSHSLVYVAYAYFNWYNPSTSSWSGWFWKPVSLFNLPSFGAGDACFT